MIIAPIVWRTLLSRQKNHEQWGCLAKFDILFDCKTREVKKAQHNERNEKQLIAYPLPLS